MNLKSLSASWDAFKIYTASHKREILTGIGVAGSWIACGLAIKATPKAMLKVEEMERRKQYEDEEVTNMDRIKTAAPCYIPALGILAGASACIVYATIESQKHSAALAAAYSMTEKTLQDYQNKVVEAYGEGKDKAIKDDIAKDKLHAAHPEQMVYVDTDASGATYPCYDAVFGQPFKSNTNTVKAAVNEINRRLMEEMFVSVNEFYYELGLKPIDIGEHLGWNIDQGMLEIDITYDRDSLDRPCMVIQYEVSPEWIR